MALSLPKRALIDSSFDFNHHVSLPFFFFFIWLFMVFELSAQPVSSRGQFFLRPLQFEGRKHRRPGYTQLIIRGTVAGISLEMEYEYLVPTFYGLYNISNVTRPANKKFNGTFDGNFDMINQLKDVHGDILYVSWRYMKLSLNTTYQFINQEFNVSFNGNYRWLFQIYTVCESDYVGGAYCTEKKEKKDDNICKPDNDTGSACSNVPGKITCLPGWRRSEKSKKNPSFPVSCQDIDECTENSTNPCLNDGKCINTVGSYSCCCEPGYIGKHCEKLIVACLENHCRNGGSCVEHDDYFSCKCPPEYTGFLCQKSIEEVELPQPDNVEQSEKSDLFVIVFLTSFPLLVLFIAIITSFL